MKYVTGLHLGKVKWARVFKNGPWKICRRQPLKNFIWSNLEYLDPKYIEVRWLNFKILDILPQTQPFVNHEVPSKAVVIK